MADQEKERQQQNLKSDEEKRLPAEVVEKREAFFNKWNEIESFYNMPPKRIPVNAMDDFLSSCRYWVLRFQEYTRGEDYKTLQSIELFINSWYVTYGKDPNPGYPALREMCYILRQMFKRYKLDDVLLEDAYLW
jgi:hypothetical protein